MRIVRGVVHLDLPPGMTGPELRIALGKKPRFTYGRHYRIVFVETAKGGRR